MLDVARSKRARVCPRILSVYSVYSMCCFGSSFSLALLQPWVVTQGARAWSLVGVLRIKRHMHRCSLSLSVCVCVCVCMCVCVRVRAACASLVLASRS